MNRMLRPSALLLLTALLHLAGCSDLPVAARPGAQAPTATKIDGTTTTASVTPGDLNPIATFRTKPSVTIAWAKAWIGPEGGRLDFAGFAIEVPPGAVDAVTMFTLKLPVDPNDAHVYAEFGPHNRTFAKPIRIELPYRNTSAEGSPSTVLWFDDAIDQWVNVGGTLTPDGSRITTQVPHFSQYGTANSTTSQGYVPSGG